MNTLTISRYIITIQCVKPIKIREKMGNTLRGAFGNALKWLYCTEAAGTCDACKMQGGCLYSLIFKVASLSRKVGAEFAHGQPNPYVINIMEQEHREMECGGCLEYSMTLIGDRCRYSKEVLYAMEMMLHGQIAGEIGAFKLVSIRNAFNEEYIYNDGRYSYQNLGMLEWNSYLRNINARKLKLTLHTPTDIRVKNKLQKSLPFETVLKAVLRRISLISSCYGGREIIYDYIGLMEQAAQVKIISESLRHEKWDMYSRTSKNTVPLEGMTGEVIYSGNMGIFLPYLDLGMFVNIGKHTTSGLGMISYMWEE